MKPVIVAAARTPIGNAGGSLRHLTVDALAAPVIARLYAACPDPDALREVVLGNVRGPGGNPARYAALRAGLPDAVPGLTVDRQCGSGLAAIEHAWLDLSVRPGYVIAGGAQSVSTQPLTLWPPVGDAAPVAYERAPFAPPETGDPDMGLAADLLAEERGVDRASQDAYALRSHERAVAAQRSGAFDREIVPVPVPVPVSVSVPVPVSGAGVGATEFVTRDERPRSGFTLQRLARFRPAFRSGGTVTAANSCGVNDGAAGVLMVDGATHARLGVPGLRVLSVATAGGDPRRPGWGIVPAATRALADAGVAASDLDAVECNEAFAGQVIACLRALGIDERRNCVEGGAIALGHPWAASGAVLLTRLFAQLLFSQSLSSQLLSSQLLFAQPLFSQSAERGRPVSACPFGSASISEAKPGEATAPDEEGSRSGRAGPLGLAAIAIGGGMGTAMVVEAVGVSRAGVPSAGESSVGVSSVGVGGVGTSGAGDGSLGWERGER